MSELQLHWSSVLQCQCPFGYLRSEQTRIATACCLLFEMGHAGLCIGLINVSQEDQSSTLWTQGTSEPRPSLIKLRALNQADPPGRVCSSNCFIYSQSKRFVSCTNYQCMLAARLTICPSMDVAKLEFPVYCYDKHILPTRCEHCDTTHREKLLEAGT